MQEGKTIGQLMEEMRQKSGIENRYPGVQKVGNVYGFKEGHTDS